MNKVTRIFLLLVSAILLTTLLATEVDAVFAIAPGIKNLTQGETVTVIVYEDEPYDLEKSPKTTEFEEEKREFTKVPLFNQQDYPYTEYSQGSVATSGCGITCLAMVASYHMNEFVSPDDLAKKFNKSADNNVTRMENASEYLDLPLQEKTWYWSKAYEALKNGSVVISLQRKGLFTSEGHFIVLTGLTEDGKVMVNDPYGANWDKNAELVEGFANGFTIEQITEADAAYWIYEPKYPQSDSE